MVSCPFFLGYPSIVKKRSNGLDGKLPFLPQLPFHHKETATNKATDFMVPFHGYPSILKKRGCKQSNRLDGKLPNASWRNVSYVFMCCFHAVDPWCALLQPGVLGWKWRWWGWWSCLQACVGQSLCHAEPWYSVIQLVIRSWSFQATFQTQSQVCCWCCMHLVSKSPIHLLQYHKFWHWNE